MLWQERVERLAVAQCMAFEEPAVAFEQLMNAFEASLDADPEESGDAVVDRRIAELLEEVA